MTRHPNNNVRDCKITYLDLGHRETRIQRPWHRKATQKVTDADFGSPGRLYDGTGERRAITNGRRVMITNVEFSFQASKAGRNGENAEERKT